MIPTTSISEKGKAVAIGKKKSMVARGYVELGMNRWSTKDF